MTNGGTGHAPHADDGNNLSWRKTFGVLSLAGRRLLVLDLTLVIVQGLLPLAGLWAMQWLVDAVADGMRAPAGADRFSPILQATLLAATVAVLGNLVRGVASVVTEHHGRLLADRCTAHLQQHAARLDLGEFDRPEFHDLLQRAGTEAAQRPVRLAQDLGGLLGAGVQLLAMATVLALVQPWLPLAVAAAAAPIAWVRRRHAAERFAWHRDHTVAQREQGYLGAVLTGRATAKDVRILGLWATLGQRLEAVRAGLRAGLANLAVRRARDELWVHTLASLAMFGAYLYLGNEALAGGLTLGGLVLHAQAVQRAQNSVRDVFGAGAALAEDRLFLRPWFQFLELESRIERDTVPPAAPALGAPPRIEARGVGFTYAGQRDPALFGMHFGLAAGERVAVVGANGSGKSTLLKLLCRLYDPTTGALRIDGQDLRGLDTSAWRPRVAALLQDANAFELTLGENLRLSPGNAPRDDAALWHALRLVGLHDRVRALPLGLDTPCSRRLRHGVDWSGGEWRRLLLARTLAQPADLLLLDEPFAALDGAAATALEHELQRRAGRQTLLVIDHRLAALRCVDRLLLLDGGRLVADGAPATLLRTEPRLQALFPDWRTAWTATD